MPSSLETSIRTAYSDAREVPAVWARILKRVRPMRVSLLYHEDAGEGISARSLQEAIEKAGHVVEHIVMETPHLERLLEGTTELLVAAGGDGTVRRAVQALAGSDIPLA